MWRPPEWKADFSARRRTCRSGLLMAAVPRLNEIDEQQRREGRRQRDGGNGRRPAIIILLQFDHDQERGDFRLRSDEHTSELQSLMSTSYAVFCLNNKHITKK